MSFNINNKKASSGILPVTNPLVQSNCLYLQAAGSKGEESTSGIHLRWTLKGQLTEHLPKGDHHAGPPKGFNKQNDYVNVYRTRYEPQVRELYLTNQPTTVIDSEGLWLYGNSEDGMFRVYFRNKNKYNEVRNQTDPFSNPMGFLEQYGSNLIEVESNQKLFFATQLTSSNNGVAKTEVLSVETNLAGLSKNVTFRRTISDFSQKIFAENGRSIRFIPTATIITKISFEFYEDIIFKRNWEQIGKFGLSVDDGEVLRRLEPNPDRPVHAVWARYNDDEFVNIRNYETKWGHMPDQGNTIRDSVKRYIDLSQNPDNPLAIDQYYSTDNPDDSTPLEFSHFNNLQMAALDYHVARMLGLGHLDLRDEVYDGSQYLYIAHYETLVDLKTGEPSTKIDHLSMSLPTSLEDQRLSLPVRLKAPVPGMVSADPTAGTTMSSLTDADGYTHDGTGRYLSLMIEELTPDEPANSPFYYSTQEFDMSKFTYPVSVGIEYKTKGDTKWNLPELPNDPNFLNVYSNGDEAHNETVAIAIPDFGNPAFVHKETKSGIHMYGSYGVNWFSRAKSSPIIQQIESKIKPVNTLLPPSSISAFLIQEELPILLTSQNEQDMYKLNPATDKTLVRLTMEYDASQDIISYQKAINGVDLSTFNPLPDNEELFADKIEVFYRPEALKQVFGMIDTVTDLPGNPLISVIKTKALPLASAGLVDPGVIQSVTPTIPGSAFPNYIGGIFTVGTDDYIIHNIVPGSSPDFPIFHILKMQIGNAFGQNTPIPFDPANFLVPSANVSFMVAENMQNTSSWGAVNPHSLKIQIGDNWPIHTEEVTIESGQAPDITYNTYYRKFRGIKKNATITRVNEPGVPFTGLYEFNFPGYTLNKHPQFSDIPGKDSVQWYRGSLRVSAVGQQGAEKRILKVIRIDNIGSGDLRVFALDESHSDTNPLQPDVPRTEEVNFYPGYRAYLHYNAPCRLTKDHVIPQDPDVLEKYSIFGARAIDNTYVGYNSRISIPTMMFGRRIEAPATPQAPLGSKYATRPDYFGRSSYAFTTQFNHRPFSVMYLRSNDDILLSSLYNYTADNQVPAENSIEFIREKNSDEFFNSRLLELANAEYDHSTKLFKKYNGFGFPLPDNEDLFKNINLFIKDHNKHFQENISPVTPPQMTNLEYEIIPKHPSGKYGKVTFYDFIKQTIQNSYVPLTEIPILYQHIKGGEYQPIPKAQVIRAKNGAYLNPTSPDFDMAPMMKVVGNNKTTFVDFTLDGASTSVYFYSVKEVNAQLVQGEMSTAVGPVKMVNSFPLKTPEIKSVIPVLQDEELGISPKMQVTINSYKKIYNVKKAKLYRALTMQDAVSVRTMKLVKELDLEAAGVLNDKVWTLEDDFADLLEVPFSDPLYYRVTVEAEVEYAEANYTGNPQSDVVVTEYAPSEASKIMVTTITENVLPKSPFMQYKGTFGRQGLSNVTFTWARMAYKAKYHVYKMSEQGNWRKIKTLEDNSSGLKASIKLALKDTNWGSGSLGYYDEQGNILAHHFKVVTENTSGMFSKDENILTIGRGF
ncbi:hypothetical protein EG359_19215 [Chryseobacterium joostei]|uniref:Uncharacterized protein n=1 Tax=Chryseobacterium joostei TaxID=112234 RepID=A0A1N7J2U9_9FLAO|nr:hypothetical protein [Chryseobacterium joostei]AZB01604.1 hypothetical protein EG359_19215 [Chryseobacterium joostei]SIS43541.1 hypothetical protein SAMN05421768_107215 [Chryseobacterium joostei]